MAQNYLEQLVAEWYKYQGYFVRCNINVGKRVKGGYECELDVVAFNPKRKHLVQIEPSMDTNSWAKREKRYKKKFEAGRKYIPLLFEGLKVPVKIEQIALFGYASNKNYKILAGGKVLLVSELLEQIIHRIKDQSIPSQAISEDKPILRTLQFVCNHRYQLNSILFEKTS